jgi:DNA-binding response OmpR family regulator
LEIYKFEDLVVDTNKHKVYFKQQEIELTATEFSILLHLIRHPGRVYTRDNLLDILGKTILDRNIDVHITNLRKKLGPGGRFIKTIRGIGYKLDAE